MLWPYNFRCPWASVPERLRKLGDENVLHPVLLLFFVYFLFCVDFLIGEHAFVQKTILPLGDVEPSTHETETSNLYSTGTVGRAVNKENAIIVLFLLFGQNTMILFTISF